MTRAMTPPVPQPTVASLLAAARTPTLSLEFFPPKTLLGFGVLGSSIERMRSVRPDFTSCTYGAGGSRREHSFEAWELLARMGFSPVVAHLTCIGASRADLEEQIHRIHQAGIRNIMCLRGDPPQGETAFRPHPDGLAHAADLLRLVKSLHPDICCGVGGYPETHPESPSPADDLRHLKEKVDAGADFVTTQLFYSNDPFFRFRDACRRDAISVPILPGLMPALSHAQIFRSVQLSRATVPAELADALQNATDEAAARDLGIRWLVGQIDSLVAHGVPGIHLYILNQANTVLHPLLADAIRRFRRT